MGFRHASTNLGHVQLRKRTALSPPDSQEFGACSGSDSCLAEIARVTVRWVCGKGAFSLEKQRGERQKNA